MPVPALQLCWSLEDRGCYLRVVPDGVGLLAGPRRLLTDADRALIREHREQFIALVHYVDEVVA